jgi:CheY-like chemotaxis protein
MVVDDDRDLRLTLTELLSMEGYEVVAARSPEAAVTELTLGAQPAVVILDLWLPGIGSAGLLRAVRRSSPNARVIVLSAWPAAKIELDVDAVLTKPCEGTTLVRVIDKLAAASGPAMRVGPIGVPKRRKARRAA